MKFAIRRGGCIRISSSIIPNENVSSFAANDRRGLTPRKFWTQLNPAQPSNPRRLVIYLIVILLPAFVALQVALWQFHAAATAWFGGTLAYPLAFQHGVGELFSAHRIDSDDHLAARADRDVDLAVVTAMGLMVFRASMRMARSNRFKRFAS